MIQPTSTFIFEYQARDVGAFRFKIGVVIPLKSKRVAEDWDNVCRCLEATVASVINQSLDAFEVAVVGHEYPEFLKKRAKFSQVLFIDASDLEPPDISSIFGDERQVLYERDRCRKIAKGIATLHKRCDEITHWFALDADDLVCMNFVHHLSEHLRPGNACIIDRGFFYYRSLNRVRETREFSQYCGSSAVLPANIFALPAEPQCARWDDTIFGRVSHVHMKDELEKMSIPVYGPPEPLMMYVLDTGENISSHYYSALRARVKRYIASRLLSRRITESQRRRFALSGFPPGA